MLFSSFRAVARRGPSIASRAFSTTSAANAAAEVKSLGVIGAGQMVGLRFLTVEIRLFLTNSI